MHSKNKWLTSLVEPFAGRKSPKCANVEAALVATTDTPCRVTLEDEATALLSEDEIPAAHIVDICCSSV